jgi:hypothetical protein
MDEAIRNWIKSSDYDVRTATALLKSRRYVYVIFMAAAERYLAETKGFLKWLKAQIK